MIFEHLGLLELGGPGEPEGRVALAVGDLHGEQAVTSAPLWERISAIDSRMFGSSSATSTRLPIMSGSGSWR